MACFHADCHLMFMTHEKLVKHLQTHDGGRDSLYYIKYIMDHMEEGKSDAIAWVRVEAEKEKKLAEEEKLQLNKKLDVAKKELEVVKGDARHYRRKAETSKQDVNKLEAELKDAKASLEMKQAGHDKLIEAKAKLEVEVKGHDKLVEEKVQLEEELKKTKDKLEAELKETKDVHGKLIEAKIKLDIQKGDNEELKVHGVQSSFKLKYTL